MDFHPEHVPPVPRASARPPARVATLEAPIRFAPPIGRGRRLPPPRIDERETRRTSARRRRSIVEVNAAISARPTRIPATPIRDPSRWARLEALVVDAGVPRERLLDAFPEVEDIEDVFLTPDEDLAACATILVRSLLGRPSPPPASSPPAVQVRCADCRHFARSATHPRLGRCGAGEPATAAGGWWDTQRRVCSSFDAAP